MEQGSGDQLPGCISGEEEGEKADDQGPRDVNGPGGEKQENNSHREGSSLDVP